MLGCLNFTRWSLSIFSTFLLILILPVVTLLLNLGSIFTDKQYVKGLVESSGLYENGVSFLTDSIANASKNSSNENEQQDVQVDKFLTESEIKDSINKIIDKDFLKKNGNLIIDSTYEWLEGKTEIPTFTIDLKTLKDNANTVINNLLQSKIKSLPQCKITKLPKNFDIMNSDCLPKGVNINDFATQIKQEVSQINFIPSDSFSSTELKFDQNMLNTVRFIYSIIKILPIILVFLLLLFIGLIVLTSPKPKIGLVFLSFSLLLSGIILIFISVLGSSFAKTFITQKLDENKELASSFKEIVQNNTSIIINNAYNKNFTIAYILIGLGVASLIAVIIISILKKKRVQKRPEINFESSQNIKSKKLEKKVK